jgi:hypothetical protein
MPGTARALEGRHPGLNTKTRWGNVLGGAYYLAEQYHTFKRWDYALAAYNAGPGAVKNYDGIPPYRETQDYVRTIMGKKPHGGAMTGGAAELASSDPVASDSPLVSPVEQPAYTKQDAALEGLRALAEGNYDPTAGLAALRHAAEASARAMQSSPVGALPSETTQLQGLKPAKGGWQKFVVLHPGADRKGVRTKQPVLRFVGSLGAIWGSPLTITTGTNHNRMTVDGNVSNHWNGMAADIAMSGEELTRLGRLALIRAGMPRAEAMKVTGGLFNVGRYQIIFNTHQGGNHFNHLHVGIR